MATATKKIGGATLRPRGAAAGSDPASPALVISPDSRGDCLWEIVEREGKDVLRSAGFAAPGDAERAAHHTHDGAGLAHGGPRDPDERKAAAS